MSDLQAGANDLGSSCRDIPGDEAQRCCRKGSTHGHAIARASSVSGPTPVMRLGGERASLPVSNTFTLSPPRHIARPVMIQNAPAAFPQHREIIAKLCSLPACRRRTGTTNRSARRDQTTRWV